MTFSGVRSSCDMVATNSDLSRLASRMSSRSRAFWRAIAAWLASPRTSAASPAHRETKTAAPPRRLVERARQLEADQRLEVRPAAHGFDPIQLLTRPPERN